MGKVRKSKKLIRGFGINDADYDVTRYEDGKKVSCYFYQTWKNMLERCYSEKKQVERPTYRGCTVCDEWLTFSNFKAWMEQQEWRGKQLDKDLLKDGNKVYCPEWCIFVDRKINSFVTDSGASRGKYMIGASWDKASNKFASNCNNPFTSKQEKLGYFTDELQAHLAWKARKHELACELADSDLVTDPRLSEVLRTRYL